MCVCVLYVCLHVCVCVSTLLLSSCYRPDLLPHVPKQCFFQAWSFFKLLDSDGGACPGAWGRV